MEGSGRPLRPLRAGVVFWRARALDGRGSWTAPWELFVPPGGRAPDATRGLRLDANADGFADAVVRDQNGEAATDRLHVYLGGPGGLNPASDTVLPLDTSHFGVPAASAGDVNGDGFGDVAVSDGRGVVVYAGSAAGLAAAPLSVSPALAGIQPFDFGWQLLAGGDVNGDGYGDVFVSDGGRHVWLYLGSPAGLPATPVWTLDASATGSSAALLTAADLNGDGFGDVVVKYGGTETGFRVFRGGAAGLEPSGAGTFVARPQLPSGTAGDLNGDGIPDLVTTEFTQLAFFPGGHAFPPAGPTQVLPTANPVAPLQIADFDGDGRADLAAITSTPTDNIYFTDDRVDVHRGTPGGFATPPHTTILETAVLPDNTLNFGERISAADFDGDGRDDLLVGAPAPFPTPFFATTNPAVFVFAGSSAGLQPAPAPRITGVPGYASWVSAAAPGDVL
ncbi:MAG TPA: VCBS repeat-containing protein [Polyangia bacterium]|nr:VCBS repeat-containing protein [Polyangia bacterium]